MTDIFLSYTEKDRETARRVAAMLEAVGWTVWWDRRIPAGETWRNVLEKALESMRCMIVLWSVKSIESEWVCEEASEGRQQGKLVPVLIEPVRPPAGFREIQAADLTGWDGSREFEGMRLLLTDLENMLGKPLTAASGASARPDDSGYAERRPDAATGLAGPPASTVPAATRPAVQHRVVLWSASAALLLAGVAAYLILPAGDQGVSTPALSEAPRLPVQRVSPASEPLAPVAPVTAPGTTTVAPASATVLGSVAAAQTAAARPARERTASARHSATTAASNSRCADLLASVQLGETLSADAQSVLRKECHQ